jgi:hypothetical protein
MPYFQTKEYFEHVKDCEVFNKDYDPGTEAPLTGIYRCIRCNWEVVAEAGRALPTEELCRRHSMPNGPTLRGLPHDVAWRLMAAVIQIG